MVILEVIKHVYGIYKLKQIAWAITKLTAKRQKVMAKAKVLNTQYEELQAQLIIKEGPVKSRP